ncbi:tripartite tricarboxylate transporter substrate binding protein [Brevibacillus humidisoli]|uniref:tripartite tricarboxylate transporter substrate binding protein n=1 Tax=Brevibacillus humidisoli TaxID=2895522 RepID=UPI001E637BE0|nr:tripartite tricarboxylate transporter substrate binding protein [Brevibacillus humidisoli]UFJ43103.1 tripartite tricarboxylate transporter substrate binding protein [Brevibacillus humidisoli]
MAAVGALLGLLGLAACGSGANSGGATGEAAAGGSDFPQRDLTIIVPFSAGGGTDATARALAKAAEQHLGQSIAVVNKTGGSGAVGFTEGANAKPDGYTLTMLTMEITTLKHLKLSELTHEDFKPIAQVNFDPPAITVRADAPYNTVQEFFDYVKENPGKVKVGNSGPGALWHMAAIIMEKNVGVQFTHVPFEGANPAVTALLGGHIDMVPVSPAEVKAHVEAGKLKTLAVVDEKQSDVLPGVKTLEEQMGIKMPPIGSWRGLAVPKETPEEVVSILADAFMKAAESEEFKTYMKNNGLGLSIKDASSFQKMIVESHDYFGELIPELGIPK